LAKAACIWAAIDVWTLVASVSWVAAVVPQFKSGSVVAVSSGVHASGEISADFAVAVWSDAVGSLEQAALEQIVTAAKMLNHLLETMMFDFMTRSS
jgi:hypothetical protein